MKTTASASAPRSRSARAAAATSEVIHRSMDRPVGQRSLRDLEPELPRRHGDEIAPEPPRVRPIAAAHLQNIAKALRRDDADPRALAFQERIGPHRRAMHDRAEIGRSTELPETFQEAFALVATIGRHLGGAETGASSRRTTRDR
mgnify:CR=1 FL=1